MNWTGRENICTSSGGMRWWLFQCFSKEVILHVLKVFFGGSKQVQIYVGIIQLQKVSVPV